MTAAAAITVLTADPEDDAVRDDWRAQADAIERVLPGVAIAYRPWTGPFEPAALTLPVMAWGYHRQAERWQAALDAWQASGARFANPVGVLRWNTDKAYLLDLERRGIAIVPTRDIATLDGDALADAVAAFGNPVIVKPAISAGSDRTYRLAADDRVPDAVQGRRMLVQPFMSAVVDPGELSLFFLGGALAHAIVKQATGGDFRVQPQFGGAVRAIDPPPAAVAAARAALAASGDDLLYARVDLVADGDVYRLMEIELIEPWLYLEHARDGGAAFAAALRAAIGRA